MVLTNGGRGVGDGLLDVGGFDEREVLLDLLEGPPGADQVQQVLDREAVPADTRLQRAKSNGANWSMS